ncbi:MAG: hypothetical protein HY459_02025 [Parcubacteria group bacterium]|nr:hypothetical protein [Parcubacteria group bacterium]
MSRKKLGGTLVEYIVIQEHAFYRQGIYGEAAVAMALNDAKRQQHPNAEIIVIGSKDVEEEPT